MGSSQSSKDNKRMKAELKDIKQVKYKKELHMRIVLLGPRESGKTSLISKYIVNSFNTFYIPTAKTDLSVKVLNVDTVKHPVCLYVYDTGDVDKIMDASITFEKVDMIFAVFNPLSSYFQANKITEVNTTISQFIRSYSRKYIKYHVKKPEEENKANQNGVVVENVEGEGENEEIEGLAAYKASEVQMMEDNRRPPNALQMSQDKLPRIYYIFTHKDQIEANGKAYVDIINSKIIQFRSEGIINGKDFLISSKHSADVQKMFRTAIEDKAQFKNVFKQEKLFEYDLA